MNSKLILRPMLALGLAAIAACATCTRAANAPLPHENDPVIKAPARMQGDRFAFDMFRELAASQKGNVTFSPASLEAALRLLREGAAGGTRAELDALRLGRDGVAHAIELHSANALFAASDLPLKPVRTTVQRVPFATAPAQAARDINTWCSEQTQGLIPELVSANDLGRDTALVALNALYLKAKWLHPFDCGRTAEGLFRTPSGEKAATFMTAEGSFRFAFGKDWRAVALFYATEGRPGETACFIGILPKGDARAFAKGLTLEKYNDIRRALAQADPMKGAEVTLPKMTLDSGAVSLTRDLQAAGVKSCFGAGADFSNFSDTGLQVSDVLQRCRIEFSEEETTAAAATAVIMARGLPPGISFDRPFVWAIGDLTTAAAPYFIGLCEQP